ncbi:homoserine O-acetyltransferase [Haloprofundus marisrubri]|uniref:Homoserine O-acetyltransferase n=1 Tax=Haloprofundus marisrubri TaxID=1514971 RepID=A0A0W1R3W8_9EURY|nr:homoserine O-acetyltransferase [Haloprofundus marisrubri]KTG08004.1 homoserine O-acetyltransferase [Haloprofundus marisrubri]
MTGVDRDTVSVGEFEFECGESIDDLQIAYEAYGEFTGDNAVLVCHALTGSQHVADVDRSAWSRDDTGVDEADEDADSADSDEKNGDSATAGQARAWWNDVVGPGKAIDTSDYYVVCANVPGSCYGSSGPASDGPDGDPWGTDFPPVTVGDWTRAQRRLLDALGVGRLHAVVGGSVGGMNVLDWARRYPDDATRIVVVAAAARLDPQCLALDAVARRAITTDPDWNGGDYYGQPGPENGLALARQLGHVMYLSKSSMAQKFGRRSAGRDAHRETFPTDPAASFFPYRDVESYLDYNADNFVDRFDANSYLYLTRAMDDFDLREGYDSDADALAAFAGEALLLSFTADWHFTTEQSESLAEAFRASEIPVAHHVVDSDHGHDAFLVEPENVGPPVADFLADGVEGRAVTDTAVESDGGTDTEFAPVHSSLFSR